MSKELKIYKTKDYSKFKFIKENREVPEKAILSLAEKILGNNLLHNYPILVDPKFNILDGQTRLRAAEYLGTEVYYIVTEDMGILDIAAATKAIRQWKAIDYLHLFCTQGLKDYQIFKWFMDTYRITYTIALHLLIGNNWTMDAQEQFKRGNFRVNDLEDAKKRAEVIKDFAKWFAPYRHKSFCLAVNRLMNLPDYDHDRMMHKMEYLSSKLVKCPDVESYMRILEEIYNYKAQTYVPFDKKRGNGKDK